MVYTALLNCYAREKDVEKAEATFKKLTGTGVMRSPLLTLTMREWIRFWKKMESNGEVVPDWNAYCVAADGCLKAGIMEMAMTMLKKLEEKTKSVAFDTLLKSCSRKGNKDELYRIWKPDEKRDKIYNKGYMSMISSLLMLDDIEAAEMMFKEWELSYYFRVPNILMNAYCRNNLLEKAESLIDHAMMKGSEPSDARKGDQNIAEEFIELLRSENFLSPVAHNRLLTYIKGLKSQSDGLLYDSGEWWRNRVSGDNPMADEVASGFLP
ncbi:hypothetical protein POTOM_040656 [Populus tomentosa]|uniref:Pentatricopeptide repeat-containing protein n=1 Tax=Populus tomentosa TaxID=118781 RepID=A0A8X7YSF5_POPTO|nr:hypothetical protein POTOM_040656 [Populus tomentosa]